MAIWKAGALASVGTAFVAVEWRWVALALALNLLSVAARAQAWRVVLDQAIPEPHPSTRALFSAFSVGLLGNIVLPGRAGELMRVALISRRLPHGREFWPSTLGSILAHRLFDVVPSAGLVIYVLVAARLPPWAQTSVIAVLAAGGSLFLVALLAARRDGHRSLEGLGSARRLLHLVRRGLAVLRAPIPAFWAAALQTLGWALQLAAVWSTFRAFQIDAPVSAAALVLVVVNLVLAVPLWPGSVGLFQASVALALVPSGVAYAHGLAYGIGLQAIESSVGIGLGLLFLAREGISFAALRRGPRLDLPGDGASSAEADDRCPGPCLFPTEPPFGQKDGPPNPLTEGSPESSPGPRLKLSSEKPMHEGDALMESVLSVWDSRFDRDEADEGLRLTLALCDQVSESAGYRGHALIRDLGDPGHLVVVTAWTSKAAADAALYGYSIDPSASAASALTLTARRWTVGEVVGQTPARAAASGLAAALFPGGGKRWLRRSGFAFRTKPMRPTWTGRSRREGFQRH